MLNVPKPENGSLILTKLAYNPDVFAMLVFFVSLDFFHALRDLLI